MQRMAFGKIKNWTQTDWIVWGEWLLFRRTKGLGSKSPTASSRPRVAR